MIKPSDQDIAEALRLANPIIRKDGWLATPEEVRADPVFYHSLLAHAHTIAKLRIALGALEAVSEFGNASMQMLARETLHQIKDTSHAQ